jgi:hypothetical protein
LDNIMQPTFMRFTESMKPRLALDPRIILGGSLPARVLEYVMEWAALHDQELRDNWQRVTEHAALAPIEPLA